MLIRIIAVCILGFTTFDAIELSRWLHPALGGCEVRGVNYCVSDSNKSKPLYGIVLAMYLLLWFIHNCPVVKMSGL